jgi:hypothetical protein
MKLEESIFKKFIYNLIEKFLKVIIIIILIKLFKKNTKILF